MAKKIKEFAEKRTGDLHITGLNRVYEYFPLSDVWTIFKPTGTKTVLQCTSEVCVMSKQIRNNTFICTMTTFCKCQIVIKKKYIFPQFADVCDFLKAANQKNQLKNQTTDGCRCCPRHHHHSSSRGFFQVSLILTWLSSPSSQPKHETFRSKMIWCSFFPL